MDGYCSSVCAKPNLDLTLSKTIDNNVCWLSLSKVKTEVYHKNFRNPLAKLDTYDSIVVVLDTKKPATPYKYPIKRPSYGSATLYTDLSNVSLNVSLEQKNSSSVQDDAIELNDSVLMKELNHEYDKIMQVNELFNSPNRTIIIKDNSYPISLLSMDNSMYGSLVDKTTGILTNDQENQDDAKNSPLLMTPQWRSEGEDKLEDIIGITPLPVTVNIENNRYEMLNPIAVKYTVDTSLEPKRLKLTLDNTDNCIDNSVTTPTDFFANEDVLIFTGIKENLSEPIENEHNDRCDPCSFFNKENTDTEIKFEACIKNNFSINIDTSVSFQPSESVKNCTITSSQDEYAIPNFEREIVVYTSNEESVNQDEFTIPLLEHDVVNISDEQSLNQDEFTIPPIEHEVVNITDEESLNQDEFTIPPLEHEVVNITDEESLNQDESTIPTREHEALVNISDKETGVQNEPTQEHKIVVNSEEKTDASSDFVIFHSVNDQFIAPSAPSNTNVTSDYFLNDDYFQVNKSKDKKTSKRNTTPSTSISETKKKGVKRQNESTEDCSTHKKPRCDKNSSAVPSRKKEIAPKHKLNWALYNFSKPQDCFKAVQNQWGWSFLPDPHEDLTCRFYNSPPKYNTNFTIPGNTDNTIECLSVYENQMMEIEHEVRNIQHHLDASGSLLDKRSINRNMERWRKLNSMKSRLNDACDDAHRFYTHYKDNRTGWNAWYISEYHNNEIKHQFNILDAYTDFYGSA